LKTIFATVVTALSFAVPAAAFAAPITYTVDLSDSAGDILTGSVTTDGALGVVGGSSIEHWNFSETAAGASSPLFTISSLDSGAGIQFSSLTPFVATATSLSVAPFDLVGSMSQVNSFQVPFLPVPNNQGDEVNVAVIPTTNAFIQVLHCPFGDTPTCSGASSTVFGSTVDGTVALPFGTAAGVAAVPEPSSLSLVLLALAGTMFAGKRMRRG